MLQYSYMSEQCNPSASLNPEVPSFAEVLRHQNLEHDLNVLGLHPEEVEDQLEEYRKRGKDDAVRRVEDTFRTLLQLRLSQDIRATADILRNSGVREALRAIKIG